MKMRYLLGLCLGCTGLFFLYQTHFGEEFGKEKATTSFNFENEALEALVKVCFDDSMRQLAEKGLVEKCPTYWIYQEGVETNVDEQSDCCDCYTSKGIDLVPGAQKIVSDIVADAVTKGMSEKDLSVFEKAESKMPNAAAVLLFKSMLQRMIYSSIMSLYSEVTLFDWCPCISGAKRITLAINVVNDVCKQYKPKDHLRYTSIATGSLLQDYIILEELKVRGFTKMTINLIDPGYFSPAEVENFKKLMPLPQDKKHADYLLTIAREVDKLALKAEEAEDVAEKEKLQEVRSKLRTVRDRKLVVEELKRAQEKANVVDAFGYSSVTLESKVDQLSDTSSDSSENEQENALGDDYEKFLNTVSLTEFTRRMKEGSGTDIEVIAWENAYDYFERAKKYPDKRSDVFLLIDPDTGYFVQPSYPSLANVIRLMPNLNKQEDVYIMNPLHSSAQVWACTEAGKNSSLYQELAALLSKTKDTGQSLTTALEKRFEKRTVSREYIVDLYLLAQDMMYEALAIPHKAVVYMGKEETSKIDPLAYQKRDVVGERAREICLWETEIADSSDSESVSIKFKAEIDQVMADSTAEQAKFDALFQGYKVKTDEDRIKIAEINAKYAATQDASGYSAEIDPILASSRAENVKIKAMQEDHSAKMAELNAKMKEIRAKYGSKE